MPTLTTAIQTALDRSRIISLLGPRQRGLHFRKPAHADHPLRPFLPR
jgi:hypothetical protein